MREWPRALYIYKALDCWGNFTGVCYLGAGLTILGVPGSLECGRKISQAGDYLVSIPGAPGSGLGGGFAECFQL